MREEGGEEREEGRVAGAKVSRQTYNSYMYAEK